MSKTDQNIDAVMRVIRTAVMCAVRAGVVSSQDANDVCQESYVQLKRREGLFQESLGNFEAFVFMVATQTASTHRNGVARREAAINGYRQAAIAGGAKTRTRKDDVEDIEDIKARLKIAERELLNQLATYVTLYETPTQAAKALGMNDRTARRKARKAAQRIRRNIQ